MNSTTPGLLAEALWMMSSGRVKLSLENTFPLKIKKGTLARKHFTVYIILPLLDQYSFGYYPEGLLLFSVLQFSIFCVEELAGE